MRSASDIILKIICPALGAVMANIMFFAPFQDARQAVARADLGELNPTPWAFMSKFPCCDAHQVSVIVLCTLHHSCRAPISFAAGNCLGWVTYSFLTSVGGSFGSC
jgi:hypothetical protein